MSRRLWLLYRQEGDSLLRHGGLALGLFEIRGRPLAEDGGVCFFPRRQWGAMEGSLSRGLIVHRVF